MFNLNFTKWSHCYFSVPQTSFEINFLNYYERKSVIQVYVTAAIQSLSVDFTFKYALKVSCLYYSRHSLLKYLGLLLAREHYSVDNDGIITLILNFYYLKFCSIPWTVGTLGLVSSVIAVLTLKAFLYVHHPNGQPKELKSEDVLFILLIVLRMAAFNKDLRGSLSESFRENFPRGQIIHVHGSYLKFALYK